MQEHFHKSSDAFLKLLHSNERALVYFVGEDSDFCRMNGAKVRQAGHVRQMTLRATLIRGLKQARTVIALCDDEAENKRRLQFALDELRGVIDAVPDDPHLLFQTEPHSTEQIRPNKLRRNGENLDEVFATFAGLDLVGIYAAGAVCRGFACTTGQRNWYESYNHNLNFSLYHQKDKAVKGGYAGFEWDSREFQAKAALLKQQLAVLKRPPKSLSPGHFHAYLAPAAVVEIMELLGWGAFGMRSIKAKSSPILQLAEGRRTLSDLVTLTENTVGGVAPNFDEAGFTKPDCVPLVEKGHFKGGLVSARTAKEFGLKPTGANEHESPESIDFHPGSLRRESIPQVLKEGAYINNLWYLNYSDKSNCRFTGLTRFASFWVEGGEITAPLNVMRFDDSLFRILGTHLTGLTQEREHIFSSNTYEQRSTESFHLPGALISDFALTL